MIMTKTIDGLSLQEAIAENYRLTLPLYNSNGTKWDINTYATYASLRYPEITVPLNQVWTGAKTMYKHVCEKHGGFKATPMRLTSYDGFANQCKDCARESAKKVKRQFKHSSPETIRKAREMYANGMSHPSIAKEFGVSKSTVCRWVNDESRERNNEASQAWRNSNPQRNSEIHKEINQRPHRKASKKVIEHKRRALMYHCFGNAYIPDHPNANPEGWVEYDLTDLITSKADREEMSFVGADEDVKKRAKQQRLLEKISGEKYSLEHLIPLTMGGTHQPANFANRSLSLNCQKGNKRLQADDELFAKRLFGLN